MQKAAKQGNETEAKALAKSIVQLRKSKQQLMSAKVNSKSMGYQLQSVATNEKLVKSMQGTAKVTAKMNKMMQPHKIQADIRKYQMETEKMAMTSEMVDDLMDDAFEDD